jgi:transcription initiation factor TFIIB
MSSVQSSVDSCPDCGEHIVESNGEAVCGSCNLVVEEQCIDRGPESRMFDENGTLKGGRTGATVVESRHDRGFSTTIGNHGDMAGLSGRQRRKVGRLRHQQSRTTIRSTSERNQVYGFCEIRRLVGALGLPENVQESACALFRSAQDAGLMPGRSLEGFAAAAVYATCRVQSLSRSLEEVADVGRGSQEELTVAYDAMNEELGLPTGPVDPSEYIPRFVSALGLSAAVEQYALAVAEVETATADGRKPTGVAAACVDIARQALVSGVCTQEDVAGAADVSARTVQNVTAQLREDGVLADVEVRG